MKKLAALGLTLVSLFSLHALGHGEDKPGPNKGFIRMPGAFHTELVPVSASEMKVYLLDINWQNPITQNSSVEISFSAKPGTNTLCKVSSEKKSFTCPVPAGVDLQKKGQVVVKAKRDGQVGNEALYELPLMHVKKSQNEHSGHGSH